MKAVHVHRIAGVGGSERHLLTLLPALRRHGVEPAFVGLDLPGAAPDAFYAELARSGVEFVRLRSRGDLDPVLAARLVRTIRGLGADVVHTHLVHADVYGAAAAVVGRSVLVSTKHNDDPFRAGPFRHVERLLARRARAIVAITEALRGFLVERAGLPPEKVVTIPYGLDEPPPAWGPNPPLELPAGARVLLAVSRLAPQKGLDVAVKALPAIRERHPQAMLVVAGEGPERDALAALAARLGVADAVVLLGRAGDVAALYRAADVFVHPARWDGFGLVLLEAMLSRLPVVASRVSSVPEIVADGATGLLVAADDPKALAAAVGRVLGDEALRLELGRAGRERALAEFSVEEMARRTAELYRR